MQSPLGGGGGGVGGWGGPCSHHRGEGTSNCTLNCFMLVLMKSFSKSRSELGGRTWEHFLYAPSSVLRTSMTGKDKIYTTIKK